MRGLSWTMLGGVGWRFLSAISTFLLARLLGPEMFGELGMVQSTAELFSIYAGMRLGGTAARFIARHRATEPEKAARILRLVLLGTVSASAVAGTAMLLLAPLIATDLLGRAGLSLAVAMGAALLVVNLYGSIQETALTGFEDFKSTARLALVRGFSTLLLVVPLGYIAGVEGAIGGLIIVGVVHMLQGRWLLLRQRDIHGFPRAVSLRETFRERAILWQFALPGMLMGTLNTGALWVARLLVVRNESGFLELGLFMAANSLRVFVLFVPAMLARVALPIMAEAYGRGSRAGFDHAVSINIKSILLISAPVVILVIVLGQPLSSLFGRSFDGMASIIPVLMFSVLLHALTQAVGKIFESASKQWTQLTIKTAWTAALLIGTIFLTPTFGALGLAWSILIAEAILLVLAFFYVDRFIAPRVVRQHLPHFFGTLLLASVAGGVSVFADGISQYVLSLLLIAASLMPLIVTVRRV